MVFKVLIFDQGKFSGTALRTRQQIQFFESISKGNLHYVIVGIEGVKSC